jgi:hypothetical protein
MTVYEHNETRLRYTIVHQPQPYKTLDGCARVGIWAYPYNHDGKVLFFKSSNQQVCMDYVVSNFTAVIKDVRR